MKLEPLKNKGNDVQPENDEIFYNEEDVKSAVEWLKGKMAGSLDNKNFRICLDGINKAFEDVIEK